MWPLPARRQCRRPSRPFPNSRGAHGSLPIVIVEATGSLRRPITRGAFRAAAGSEFEREVPGVHPLRPLEEEGRPRAGNFRQPDAGSVSATRSCELSAHRAEAPDRDSRPPKHGSSGKAGPGFHPNSEVHESDSRNSWSWQLPASRLEFTPRRELANATAFQYFQLRFLLVSSYRGDTPRGYESNLPPKLCVVSMETGSDRTSDGPYLNSQRAAL